LFIEASFFKKPEIFLPNPSYFDKRKRGLYFSVLGGVIISVALPELLSFLL